MLLVLILTLVLANAHSIIYDRAVISKFKQMATRSSWKSASVIDTDSYATCLDHVLYDISNTTRLIYLYFIRSPIPKHKSYYNTLLALKRGTIHLQARRAKLVLVLRTYQTLFQKHKRSTFLFLGVPYRLWGCSRSFNSCLVGTFIYIKFY